MVERGIQVDLTFWPLVVQRVGTTFLVEDMHAYIKELDALMARRDRFASVVLVKQKGTMDRAVIGMYGDWVKKNTVDMKNYYLGCAFVFPGEVFRFILSAILLAAPAPVPHAVFGKAEEARDWAGRKLVDAGIRVPRVSVEQMWAETLS
ncbi:MAG: hypothetical protein AB2A00_20585 [Myxococcota bacterium]